MYKRIYDSEEIVVDYYNDGKPMIRVSQFEDGHFREEHFVEIPVDAVEVVRCKECKYSSCNPVKLTYGCNHPSGLRGFIHEGFYFCSYGERRTK